MTTIVVTRKDSLACIGADSMAKYGETLEPAAYVVNHDKLIAVGDAWLGPTGPASAQLLLTSCFSNPEPRRDFSGVNAIYETLREMQAALKEDYFLNPKEDEHDPFDSMQMEILIVSPSGIFGAYPLRSVQEYTRFYSFGSGAELALGAMHAVWETATDAQEVARAGLEAAATFDDSSAGPFTLHTLQLGGARI